MNQEPNLTTHWLNKEGHFLPLTKQEYLKDIDLFEPITMFKLLYDVNVPFIREVYLTKLKYGLMRGKSKQRIIGQYIATMKTLKGYKSLTYRMSIHYNKCSFNDMIKRIEIEVF